jgi:hypothetical protein
VFDVDRYGTDGSAGVPRAGALGDGSCGAVVADGERTVPHRPPASSAAQPAATASAATTVRRTVRLGQPPPRAARPGPDSRPA